MNVHTPPEDVAAAERARREAAMLEYVTGRAVADTREVELMISPSAPLLPHTAIDTEDARYGARVDSARVELVRHGHADLWTATGITLRGKYTVDGETIGMSYVGEYRRSAAGGYSRRYFHDLPEWLRVVVAAEQDGRATVLDG
jgi:hypothetical protein